MLTGDELFINRSYLIKDASGNDVILGKLLKREKAYCYFHESYSGYNNSFTFEHKPPDIYRIHESHNIRRFYVHRVVAWN